MEKIDVIWKIFSMYILIIFFILLGNTAFAQIEVIHFNAEWNSANGVPWVMDLEDCKTIGLTDITKNPDIAKKHKLKIISIEDLIAYRLKNESLIKKHVTVSLPTKFGKFKLIGYKQY